MNSWDGTESHHKRGSTNSKGECTLWGKGVNDVSIYASKKGYYTSGKSYKFEEYKWMFKIPWNPKFEIVLRKKNNPIPLYANNVEIKMPIDVNSVGYDFYKSDLVKPYGKGVNTNLNIFFSAKVFALANYEYQLRLDVRTDKGTCFAAIDEQDTFSESVFKYPYNAYIDKYNLTNIVSYVRYTNGESSNNSIKLNNNFFFRIPTPHVNHFYYGRINNLKIQVSRSGNRYLYFTYYLNPTSDDRNLEFDPENNLIDFSHLRERDRPSIKP